MSLRSIVKRRVVCACASQKDPEAHNFNNMFPLEPENQPETNVIPNEEHEQHVQRENVDTAIQNQKKEKASGPDHTTAECFKHLPDHMIDKLKDIINAAIDLGHATNLARKLRKIHLHKERSNKNRKLQTNILVEHNLQDMGKHPI